MAGFVFAVFGDTNVVSSTAMGVKWSGDLGGRTVTVGLGQSDVSGKSETSMSASFAMNGFTGKFITSINDNGKAVAAVTEAAATASKSYVAAAAADATLSGFSISYNLDALTITAFTTDVQSKGTKDKGYSGVGVSQYLGGTIAKAGLADVDGQSLMDFGVSFSF